MKIVTWNCNGALRNKFERLLEFGADVYVVQECEDPSQTKSGKYTDWAENYLWTGDRGHKGLGIFAGREIRMERLAWSNVHDDKTVKHFLPCRINETFDLLGVWAHQNDSSRFAYIGQLWKYLQTNRQQLGNTILAGDFNGNPIWDRKKWWWNYSDVVRELREIGIESIYHQFTGDVPGKEQQPTLFLLKSKFRPYHIDYLFAPKAYADRLLDVQVGKYEDWITLSDHMPVVGEFG